MIVSLYRNAFDEHPHAHKIAAFEELADVLGDEHQVRAPNERNKTPNDQRAFNPAEFDGNGRKIPNVLRVHFGAVDIDKKSVEHVTRVLDKFKHLRSFVYSTFSHGAPGVAGLSLRWLFPFSRPIEVHGKTTHEWEPYIAGLQALTDNIIDTEKDPTRLFFVPTKRPEADTFAAKPFLLYQRGDGQALDVDAVITLGRSVLAQRGHVDTHGKLRQPSTDALDAPEGMQPFTANDLVDVATTLKRSQSSAMKAVGKCIDAVAAGLVYTKDNNRDDMLFRMCSQISEYFPNANPVDVARLFEASCAATNALHGNGDVASDLLKIVEKIERTQRQVRARLELRKEEHAKQLAADISAAFAGIGITREHPYTETEIEFIKSDVGATSYEELSKQWIIQNGGAFYLLLAGKYLAPVPEKALLVAARRDLAPAHTAGVNITGVTDEGDPYMLTKDMLLQRYATCARGTLVDLNAQKTSYNRATQIITEAPCPMRTDIVPCFDPNLDEWIGALGGDEADKLRQWVAFVTFLDRPAVAVYLDGPPGAGKTLFAKALSRIWGKGGPTALKDALANFNDAILRNPVLLADEAMPRDMLEDGTAILREFQQNTTRKLMRKFMPAADMIGAIRLIMASNNRNMIETNEALTNVDIEAITERIMYVKASTRARDILKSWGDAACAAIVTEDRLAAHALYLREHSQHKPSGRFMIAGSNGHNALSRSLTTHSGVRAIVCQWLVGYLQSPVKFDQLNTHLCHVRDGQLLVNANALATSWETYVTNAKAPRTHHLSQALAGLSHVVKKQYIIHKHKHNFYVIDTENLITWAEETGISSREQIESALTTDTKISGTGKLTLVSSAPSPFTSTTNGQQPREEGK